MGQIFSFAHDAIEWTFFHNLVIYDIHIFNNVTREESKFSVHNFRIKRNKSVKY